MHEEELFFMRKPWEYNPENTPPVRTDASLGFDTRALHAGFKPLMDLEQFRAFVPPIVPAMTYPYKTFDQIPYPVYGRTKTPTAALLEERLAALEGGEACLTAGSGSQALFNLIFTLARPGDNIVCSLNIFGEGYKQAATIFPERCGVEFHFVKNPADPKSWDAEIDARTKLVWVETPSNPTLFVTDIAAVAEVAHARGVPLLGGAIVGPEALTEDIRWNTTEFIGSIMQPFDSWLTLQYLETLGMRMARHSANSQVIAEFLADHPKVAHVNHTGLAAHPQYDLAQKQMSAPGGLMSFVVKGGMPGAASVMNAFELICHAVTFGTSRTICMHPPTITHEHMTPAERAAVGIHDGLIRLSVGLEDPTDLIADLDQALAKV